jgi:O-antigen/teichoic acid export membrane protein
LSSSSGLKSTGVIVFSGRIVSAFTGLLFTVMAARWLNTSGFGTQEVIVTLVTFASYPVGTVAYWATRDIARGRLVGRTALISSALLSFVGLMVYLGFTYLTFPRIAASVTPFLLGALLVPLSYWNAAASAMVTGYRPSVYGISLAISEVAKIVVAYEGLYVYRLGIEGVIVALLTAYLIQSAVSTYMVRNVVSEKFDSAEVRRWARLAWLPALSYLPTSLAVADTYVVALSHGTSVVGIYQASFNVASVVTYSLGLVFSMYPLLLKGGDTRLPAVSLEFSLLFAVPMAVGCATLSGQILYLFGPNYVDGALGLGILAFMFVFNNVSLIIDSTLMGTEKVDTGQTPSFGKLAGSNLVFVPLANIAYGIVYLVLLYLALSFANSNGFGNSTTVAIWASIQFVVTIAFILVKLRRTRGVATLLPGMSVAYYFVAAAAMAGIVYVAAPNVAIRSVDTLIYGGRLLLLVLLGAVVYFGVVYALDSKFRELFKSFLRQF